MFHNWVSSIYRSVQGTPCFQVYGKGRSESHFHVIDIYATSLRDWATGIPLFRGICIT